MSAFSERGREKALHQDLQPNVLAMGNERWWSPLLLWISCHLQPCFSGCHLCFKEVLPDLNFPVIQCRGCRVLHALCLGQWLSKEQSSAESGLGNLNLNHCKCNHTQVQHFYLTARWEEKYEKAMCHLHGSSLFSPPPLPPRVVCSVAPAVPAQAWPQASATASWSKGHVSSNKRCKIEPLGFQVGEISDQDLKSSN